MGSERVSMELMDQRHRTRREGSDEQVGQRASFKFNIRAFHDAVLELGSVPLPLSRRGLIASSPKTAKALTRIWSE